jgi:hypothetical protein
VDGVNFRMEFYDRKGEPISAVRWRRLFDDKSYQILRQEQVGEVLVSTVWLGIDHGFFSDWPMIFETMVFVPLNGDECYRYATEEDAFAGHERLVAELSLLRDAVGDVDREGEPGAGVRGQGGKQPGPDQGDEG